MRKFTEAIEIGKENIFNNNDMLKDLLKPLDKWGYDVVYKQFVDYNGDLMPIGNITIENFKNLEKYENGVNGLVYKNGLIYTRSGALVYFGIIIYIKKKIVEGLVRDEQRTGRLYSTFNDDLSDLISDIDIIKQDVDVDGYTLSIAFTPDDSETSQVNLLILNDKFK